MRPALLRRASMSNDARAACMIRTRFSRFAALNASLPGRPPWPHVLGFARRPLRRGALPCATLRSRRAPCHIARCALCAPRSGLVARDDAARTVADQFARCLPDSLQAARLRPPIHRRPTRCAFTFVLRPLLASLWLVSPRALPHRVLRASLSLSLIGPPPSALFGVAARSAMISPRAMPHREFRACPRAAMSQIAHAACPIRRPPSRFTMNSASISGRPPSPPCLSRRLPSTSRGVAVHDVVISPWAMPHCALHARLAPGLWCATMRPALLRRAAMSDDASAACPIRTQFLSSP